MKIKELNIGGIEGEWEHDFDTLSSGKEGSYSRYS